jgi:hypothetical protein
MASGTIVARKAGPVGTVTIPVKDPQDGKIKINKFHVEKNASVRFLNHTGGIVKLLIPDGGSLFVPPNGVPDADTWANIPASGELILQVKEEPKHKSYPYAAYCEVISDFAAGGSAPVIICP